MASRFSARTSVSNNTAIITFKQEQKLNWLHVIYTSDANTGNRQLILQLTDAAGNVYFDTHAGAVQAASNTYHYEFFQGIYRETAFTADAINVPLPVDFVIPAGFKIVIKDDTDVSSADSFVMSYQTETL